MNRTLWKACASWCVLILCVVWAASAGAQTAEKEKPPMYSYIANWAIPRAQWGEMEKSVGDDQKILDQAIAKGTIVAYGSDENLVHSDGGFTHDNWWSANSMAGVLNVLDQFYKSGSATSPVLQSATKHWDSIWVSRHYNWHSGSFKGAYTRVAAYKLKADAPDDAVETLSKSLIVPLLEKQLADGTIHEYEVDTQAVHTEDPGLFLIVYIAASAEGLDKVNAAVADAIKTSPLSGSAFGAMTESSSHRDELARTTATFK